MSSNYLLLFFLGSDLFIYLNIVFAELHLHQGASTAVPGPMADSARSGAGPGPGPSFTPSQPPPPPPFTPSQPPPPLSFTPSQPSPPPPFNPSQPSLPLVKGLIHSLLHVCWSNNLAITNAHTKKKKWNWILSRCLKCFNIHVCIWLCMYIYIYVYVCIYMYRYMYMYIYI